VRPQKGEIVDFLDRVIGDVEALVGLGLDKSLLSQARQRLAHDADADASLGAQLGELQAIVGRELAPEQFLPQIQVDRFRPG
jgi:hypothetical protein